MDQRIEIFDEWTSLGINIKIDQWLSQNSGYKIIHTTFTHSCQRYGLGVSTIVVFQK